MRIPDAVSLVYITDQLRHRGREAPDYRRENAALQDIGRRMAEQPDKVLPALVDHAIALCDGIAGGISLLEENNVFRWHHLRGELRRFSGTATPRNYSPCGITLDVQAPVLVQKPEQAYTWLMDAQVSLPECLLVPLVIDGAASGTLWVVSATTDHFHSGHVVTLQHLANFTSIALRMIASETRISEALEQQRVFSAEMQHRVQNLLTVVQSLIRNRSKHAQSVPEFARGLAEQVHALARSKTLARRSDDREEVLAGDLSELLSAILAPFSHAEIQLSGPSIQVSDIALDAIALVLHEMATNSAKYGCLSTSEGTLRVRWEVAGGHFHLWWSEFGGPPITSAPQMRGYGSSLVEKTISRLGGTWTEEWNTEGLRLALCLPAQVLR